MPPPSSVRSSGCRKNALMTGTSVFSKRGHGSADWACWSEPRQAALGFWTLATRSRSQPLGCLIALHDGGISPDCKSGRGRSGSSKMGSDSPLARADVRSVGGDVEVGSRSLPHRDKPLRLRQLAVILDPSTSGKPGRPEVNYRILDLVPRPDSRTSTVALCVGCPVMAPQCCTVRGTRSTCCRSRTRQTGPSPDPTRGLARCRVSALETPEVSDTRNASRQLPARSSAS